jgi:hypothetical protein
MRLVEPYAVDAELPARSVDELLGLINHSLDRHLRAAHLSYDNVARFHDVVSVRSIASAHAFIELSKFGIGASCVARALLAFSIAASKAVTPAQIPDASISSFMGG